MVSPKNQITLVRSVSGITALVALISFVKAFYMYDLKKMVTDLIPLLFLYLRTSILNLCFLCRGA